MPRLSIITPVFNAESFLDRCLKSVLESTIHEILDLKRMREELDAAIATLLGADYTRSGYLGEFMGVRLLPLMDAIVPNSQFTSVQTVLNQNQIWIMAANARKPMTIGYTAETPISLEIEPTRNAAFEVGINLTIALDVVSIFSQKAAILTI